MPAISTVLSKTAYFAILSALIIFTAFIFTLPAYFLLINKGFIREKQVILAETEKSNVLTVVTKDSGKLPLREGSMLVAEGGMPGVYPTSGNVQTYDIADAQFVGKYGDENFFYASCGMDVRTLRSGMVVAIGEADKWNEGMGGYVAVEDAFASGRATVYAHLAEINVSVGDFLNVGDKLGMAGSSGEILPGGVCQIGIALR
jgi:murein DD-endopeptidase MepM/ murein hydrolase activator NlpD